MQFFYLYSSSKSTIATTCIQVNFFLFLELLKERFALVLNSSGVAFPNETMNGVNATKLSSTFTNNHSQNNTYVRNLNKLDRSAKINVKEFNMQQNSEI
jgi:hypothetical protein